ncbi:hypothetical protein NLI96_g811 [Meripilus lineatus]|uniref:Uncharacterized protein n=1 Tax=Meripilus lineatus TaxID=2056292 RepID=A0AAD5VBN8_9APHY|nr:hypothetical protein NLI96_g811 [Physisporinus lineatus]
MECCTPAPANGSENSPSRTESTISVPTTAYLDATPTSPYTLQGWRYNPIYLKPEDEDQVISSIKPWKGSYVRGSPRVDWAVKVHPEGKRYFVRSEKQGQHVITHSNLYDNDCWETFIQIYDHVLQKFSEQEDLRAVDIVIDRNTFDDDQTPSWGYYAVDWDERIVLWPEEVNPQILIEDNGARNPYGSDHLRLASETQFWSSRVETTALTFTSSGHTLRCFPVTGSHRTATSPN